MRYLKSIRFAPTIATLSMVALLAIACGSESAPDPLSQASNPAQPPFQTSAPSSPQTTAGRAPAAAAQATRVPAMQRESASGAVGGPQGAPAQLQATIASQGGPVIPPESGGTDNPNDGAFPLTYFEHYGVNPFMEPDEDPLSTFALDGDTASYEILKRK